MAALRDSLNTCAAGTLPEMPLHWRYAWDAYHVGSAGQGAAGFSPRGPSDGATAGAQSRDRLSLTSRSAVKGERAGPAPTSPERQRNERAPIVSAINECQAPTSPKRERGDAARQRRTQGPHLPSRPTSPERKRAGRAPTSPKRQRNERAPIVSAIKECQAPTSPKRERGDAARQRRTQEPHSPSRPTSPECERAGRTSTSPECERAGLPSIHNAGGTLDPLESRQGQVGGLLAVEAPQAEEWAWCSLACRERKLPKAEALLNDWPVDRPRGWSRAVNRPENGEELEHLRACIRRGRPYGNEPWTRRAATKLGLESTFRPVGWPKKKQESC